MIALLLSSPWAVKIVRMVTYPGERQPISVLVCYCITNVLLSMLATRNNLTHGFHTARDKQSVVHTTTVLSIGMRVCGVVVPNAGPTKQSCTPEQDDKKQLLDNDTSHCWHAVTCN